MKHYYLLILSLHALSVLGQKATARENCYLKIRNGEEITTYNFDCVADMEAHYENILEEIHIPEKKKKKDNIPVPELEISITYNNKTINETVVANLSLLKETIRKIKIQLNIPFNK